MDQNRGAGPGWPALLLALLLAGCPTPPRRPAEGAEAVTPPPARATPWSVRYHDGSGNGYLLQRQAPDQAATLRYTPVTPAASSSGTYSGGPPAAGSLAPGAARELWRRVEHLAAADELHAPARMMGTGAFKLITPAGERRFLVRRCPALREFEQALRAHLKTE